MIRAPLASSLEDFFGGRVVDACGFAAGGLQAGDDPQADVRRAGERGGANWMSASAARRLLPLTVSSFALQ